MAYMELTFMIVKEFAIEDVSVKYHVGINQIKFDFLEILKSNDLEDEEAGLSFVFNLINTIQSKFKDSVVQFFRTNYVLGPKHVFLACYFVQKAFYNKYNISNSKNIELFLYLSAKRQIKSGLDAYGITIDDLKSSVLTYCIMTPIDNVNEIAQEINKYLNADENEQPLESIDIKKWELIKEFFELSDNQVNAILKSMGKISAQGRNDLIFKTLALQDLICEKMAILSLEKTKS